MPNQFNPDQPNLVDSAVRGAAQRQSRRKNIMDLRNQAIIDPIRQESAQLGVQQQGQNLDIQKQQADYQNQLSQIDMSDRRTQRTAGAFYQLMNSARDEVTLDSGLKAFQQQILQEGDQEQAANIQKLIDMPMDQTIQGMGGLASLYEQSQQKDPNWQTKEITKEDGTPGFIQINPQTGETRDIKGARPPVKSGQRLETDADGNVIFTSGPGVGMQGPTSTAIEKKILASEETAKRLDEVKELFDPESLTYQGQIKSFISTIKEKAGGSLSDEEKDRVIRKTKFVHSIEQLFNAYRKEITGAAASVKELDRLQKSMLNKKLSETEFIASFNQLQAHVDGSLKLYRDSLEKGLSPKEAAKAVDNATAEKRFEYKTDEQILSEYGIE